MIKRSAASLEKFNVPPMTSSALMAVTTENIVISLEIIDLSRHLILKCSFGGEYYVFWAALSSTFWATWRFDVWFLNVILALFTSQVLFITIFAVVSIICSHLAFPSFSSIEQDKFALPSCLREKGHNDWAWSDQLRTHWNTRRLSYHSRRTKRPNDQIDWSSLRRTR